MRRFMSISLPHGPCWRFGGATQPVSLECRVYDKRPALPELPLCETVYHLATPEVVWKP